MLPPDLAPRRTPPSPPPRNDNPPANTPPASAQTQYTTPKAQTAAEIASQYGVSNAQFQRANPAITSPDQQIPANTIVNIPTGDGEGQARTARVEPGRTLADIAAANGVTEDALRAANNLGPGEVPDPSQTLLVPVATKENADPTTLEGFRETFPSLAGRSDAELQGIIDNIKQLGSGDVAKAVQALASLAGDLQPDQIGTLVEQMGLKDNPVAKLVTDGTALSSLSTLADPDASALDKTAAALKLAESLGGIAPNQLGEVLKPYLSALPSGTALVEALNTYSDPDASALDKAKATLDLANAVKGTLGDNFPQLAGLLRSTDSFSRTLAAGLTLLDPDASFEDKAKAAIELGAEVPELAGDARAIIDFLKQNGISTEDATQIRNAIDRLPAADRLPQAVRDSLDPEVARNLTPEQADRLAGIAADEGVAGALPDALKNIKDPQALDALLGSLEGTTDKAQQKALLETLSGLKPGVADDLLLSTIDGKPGVEVLSDIVAKLDDDGRAALAKLVKDFDEDTLAFALRLGGQVDGSVLNDTLKVLGDNTKLAGDVLRVLSKVLDKAGIEVTAEIAEKVLRGASKLIPVAGALPAGYDTARMAAIAADTSLPPDIRYLALQAAKLNGTDAVLSVAEPFIAEFVVPVAADVAIGIASLAADLVISDQVAKYEADPDGYKAPEWLQVLNVGIAAAQGPQGAAELALIYGPNGAVDLAGTVARLTGTAAINGVALQQELTAQGVGEGLHLTAEGLHVLADMVRNPSKYGAAAVALGEAAVAKLSDLAEGVGELADRAREELGNLVDELKNLGAEGVQALGWIATHPGEAAEKAIGALSNLAEMGINLASEAGKQLAQAAMTALGEAREALGALGDAAKDALDAAEHAISGAVSSAMELGQRGIETLGWIAQNPGAAADIAKDALVDVASQAGELAHEAYDQLVDLGEDGVELIKDVAGKLADAGEAGVEMLQYVVENPGEAAAAVREAALSALQSIAEGVGDAAAAATDAVIGFVDNGVTEAFDTAETLLAAGGDAAKRIASAWANELSDGAKEVIGGLADLGDAGLNALGDLQSAGIGFAGDVLGGLGGVAKDATGWIPGTPW